MSVASSSPLFYTSTVGELATSPKSLGLEATALILFTELLESTNTVQLMHSQKAFV